MAYLPKRRASNAAKTEILKMLSYKIIEDPADMLYTEVETERRTSTWPLATQREQTWMLNGEIRKIEGFSLPSYTLVMTMNWNKSFLQLITVRTMAGCYQKCQDFTGYVVVIQSHTNPLPLTSGLIILFLSFSGLLGLIKINHTW